MPGTIPSTLGSCMSTTPHPDRPRPDDPQRVQRLEESVGFTEHTVEQLAQQLNELLKQTGHLARRLDAMERRLEVLTSGDGPDADSPEA